MPEYDGICAFCEKPFHHHRKKKYCSNECRAKRNWQLARSKKEEKHCERCGVAFTANSKDGVRFCSRACAAMANRKTPRHKCRGCGAPTYGLSPCKGRMYCSKDCMRANSPHAVEQRKKRVVIKRKTVKRKSLRAFHSIRFCKTCGGIFSAVSSVYCSLACRHRDGYKPATKRYHYVGCKECGDKMIVFDTKKRAASVKRICIDCKKARKRSHERIRRRRITVKRKPYSPIAIYKRDGWECYICGTEVHRYTSPNLVGRMDDEATIDHVWPLSKGGSDSPDNVKTACRKCNTAKGAREYTHIRGAGSVSGVCEP